MFHENDVTDITTLTQEVYSVSQLNREVRELIESGFRRIWVEAEISNVSAPSSGHMYFTLKDAAAQVRCAMFRGQNARLSFKPANGMQVLVCAEVSLYEARGDYQLIVSHMEPAGDGRLRMAFEQLKQKLQAEGLFDSARKKAIPAWPKRLGVITSPTGAAIRDVLTVLKRRFPRLPVLIYPVPVQGDQAAPQIAAAIDLACARAECDVLLITRGGGSLEDLWAFNEELVARAIARCTLPTLSAIGHEIDFTMADFVADLRAPTPSAAAEIISPHREQWQAQISTWQQRLMRQLIQKLRVVRDRITLAHKRIQRLHPSQQLRSRAQKIDDLEQRQQRAQLQHCAQWRARLAQLNLRLHAQNPRQQLLLHKAQILTQFSQRLQHVIQQRLHHHHTRWAILAKSLDSISPLATLSRGYAIVRDHQGQLIRTAHQVESGAELRISLHQGTLSCRVESTQT
jgi:exodeoxyribonuclease VII large subunit